MALTHTHTHTHTERERERERDKFELKVTYHVVYNDKRISRDCKPQLSTHCKENNKDTAERKTIGRMQ